MHYEGDIYRPPSEAFSLLLQVTRGCSHNKCTFCSMFKGKRFRVCPPEQVAGDLEEARATYRSVGRIFLCDGDALCLSNERLLPILNRIEELFPECGRVGAYARATDILRKTPEELAELREHGLGILYVGAESGSNRILEKIKKGETAAQIVEGVNKAEDAGIAVSVTFISGLGGRAGRREHAIESGRMISRMRASYVSLLTLMTSEEAPLYKEIQSGDFEVPSGEEIMAETCLLLQNAAPAATCVFRANHASNYLPLRGNLPADRERMLAHLQAAMADPSLLRDERFRLL